MDPACRPLDLRGIQQLLFLAPAAVCLDAWGIRVDTGVPACACAGEAPQHVVSSAGRQRLINSMDGWAKKSASTMMDGSGSKEDAQRRNNGKALCA
jgi:hypothetical protein